MKVNKKDFLEFDLFLETNILKEKILLDYNQKKCKKNSYTILNSLMFYINKYLKMSTDNEFKIKNKFARTSKEIWESGLTTGCTDYAIVFANFARQLGIPTTILHTMSEKFVYDVQNHLKPAYVGHAFCECFFAGKWILVDPTSCKLVMEYEENRIQLNYDIHKENVFIPLERVKKVEKQNIRIFNEKMFNLSQKYDVNKNISK